jgi:hypothetical protein
MHVWLRWSAIRVYIIFGKSGRCSLLFVILSLRFCTDSWGWFEVFFLCNFPSSSYAIHQISLEHTQEAMVCPTLETLRCELGSEELISDLENNKIIGSVKLAGTLYLYMKSIERAHAPKDLWERVKLPRNYGKALELIDKYLAYWPKFLVHKNKQRLTKMIQYLIRMRKLALKVRPKIMTMPAKQVQREARREAKAETAALLDKNIEKELLQRLQTGTYGDIYNFPVKEYEKVLAMEEMEAADEEEEVIFPKLILLKTLEQSFYMLSER